MLSLIMDTSNQYLVVALYEDNQCLASIQELGVQKHSENAIPYLASQLKKLNKELLDIDEMIITRGPGSYTGVRVAMTIAKTLAVIAPIKIKVVSSLVAYAGVEKAVVVLDARSQKVFVGVYEDGQQVVSEQLLPISQFSTFMEDYPSHLVLGQSEVVGYPIHEVNLVENMFTLAKQQLAITTIETLVPYYLKDVEAKQICL